MWNRAELRIWRSRLVVIGSETCSLQFDFSLFISFLIYFCFQESWKHRPQSAFKECQGERTCVHTVATEKEERAGQSGESK